MGRVRSLRGHRRLRRASAGSRRRTFTAFDLARRRTTMVIKLVSASNLHLGFESPRPPESFTASLRTSEICVPVEPSPRPRPLTPRSTSTLCLGRFVPGALSSTPRGVFFFVLLVLWLSVSLSILMTTRTSSPSSTSESLLVSKGGHYRLVLPPKTTIALSIWKASAATSMTFWDDQLPVPGDVSTGRRWRR